MVFWRPRGCVLDLQFAELQGNTVYDLSGNNNNGTIYGAQWRKGPLIGSLYFDGVDDYVEIPLTSSLDTDYVTVEIITRVEKDTSLWSVFIGKGAVRAPPYSWRILLYSGLKLGFGIYFEDGTEIFTRSASTLDLHKWYYIALTYNGSVVTGYVNASKVWSVTHTSVIYKGGNIYIASNEGTGSYLNGYLALVRVYNRALSEDEIKAHYRYLMGYVNRIKRRFVG